MNNVMNNVMKTHIINFYYYKQYVGAVAVRSRTTFVNPKDLQNARRKLLFSVRLLEPGNYRKALNAQPVILN